MERLSYMVKPVRMKKINAVILDEKKERVLRELKEIGVIHFVDAQSDADLKLLELDQSKTTWIRTEASDLSSRIERILEIFKVVSKEKKLSLIVREVYDEEKIEVVESASSEFFDDIDEKLIKVEDKVLRISSQLEELKNERENLAESREVISMLQKIRVDPNLMEFKLLKVWTGSVPTSNLEGLKKEIEKLTDHNVIFSERLTNKDSIILLMVFKEYEVDVNKILRNFDFGSLQIPINLRFLGLDEASSKVESRLFEINEKKGELLHELREVMKAKKKDILCMKELLQIEKMLDEVTTLFGRTSKTYAFTGWVPNVLVDKALKTIHVASEGYCMSSVRDPKKGETPPTLLENPKAVEPWALLTNTYGTPLYNELDPTKVIALTFPLVFGIMFGDVGQGLLLAMMGYLLGFRFKVDKAIARFGRIILYSGIFSTIMGFIYGSVFGLEIIHHSFVVSPLHDAQSLIKFVLYLGLVLFSLGCILNIYNAILNKKYFNAFFDRFGLVGLWFLWGGVIMVVRHFDNLIEIFKNVYTIPAILIPLFLMGIGEKIEKREGLLIISINLFETVIVFMSNSISHIRIAAIAIVHASLFSVMLQIMFVDLPGSSLNSSLIVFLQVLVFVFGNMVIFAMEALSAFIQTTRLHYYELFSKFYKGRGESFKPFKVTRKYTVPKNI